MTVTTFTTQRQLMRKNMPESALTGQYAQQQKILLYVLPVVFAVGGIAFPIGVLLYWSTSNLWTMGQQFYVIRNNPTPGTPAAVAKQERDKKRHPERQVAATDQTAPEPRGAAATAARAAEEAVPQVNANARGQSRLARQPGSTCPDGVPHDVKTSTRTVTRRPRVKTSTNAVDDAPSRRGAKQSLKALENEGDIAADYLEELLDIADFDGDLDMDVEGDRASVSIVGDDLDAWSATTARCSTRCRS